MLRRRLRLSRPAFAGLRTGKRVKTAHFLIIFTHTPEGSGGLAVVVPKKVAARAVDRHRLKRRVLAAVRDWASRSVAVAIHALPGSPLLPYTAIEHELTTSLTNSVRITRER